MARLPGGIGRVACPVLATVSLVAVAGAAGAHGAAGAGGVVEARTLPPWVLWSTGALVVALSFAMVGLFLTREREPAPRDGEPVDAGTVTGLPRTLVGTLRLLGLLGLLVVVAAGLVPWDPGPGVSRLVWLGVWALGPILAYTVGNWWVLVSPFRALAGLAERLRGRGRPLDYPEALGAWPSLMLLLGLVALEVGQPASATLARAVIAYTGFTLAGMVAFGARTWLTHVEVLDRTFAWFASLAPSRWTPAGIAWSWPGAELVEKRAAGAGDASFVVGLLYAANVDGFLSTGSGLALQAALGHGLLATLAVVLGGFALFLAAFWGCAWWISRATGTRASVGQLGAVFAVTLVPIGVGYHLAHNLAYVVDNLPLLVDALADPLALNPGTAGPWNLLSRQATLSAGLSIGLVVLGHVGAVVLAHHRSFGAFPGKVQAVKSELPLTAMMVVYTLVSLWIVTASHGGGGV